MGVILPASNLLGSTIFALAFTAAFFEERLGQRRFALQGAEALPNRIAELGHKGENAAVVDEADNRTGLETILTP